MYIKNLKRQHKEIQASMDNLLEFINKKDIVEDAMDIAKEINILAGKLKVHLISEDNFLYPDLEKSSNGNLKKMGQVYKEEMKDIGSEFMKYKDAYNTRAKIIANVETFLKETKETLELLKVRLDKEDEELYPYL